MNNRRKTTLLTWISMFIYVGVLALFVMNIINFSSLYNNQELKYIENVEFEMSEILKENDESKIVSELEALYEKHPMEIVVKDKSGIIYSSIPALGDRNLIGLIHKDAILIEAQGSFSDYDIWYAIYNLPSAEFIIPYLSNQSILIIIAFMSLSVVIFRIRKGFKEPMTQIKASLQSIQDYNFAEIKPGSDDINYEMEKFSILLEDNIGEVERMHTELETKLQIEHERLLNTMTVSKSFVHDLKTPIHLILMENEFYLSQLKSPSKEVQELAAITINKAMDSIESINEILKMMNQDSYGNQKQAEYFDLSKQFNESIKQFATAFKINKFSAEIDVDPEIMVKMNKPTLKLLIHNLVSNMTRYANPGSKFEMSIRAQGDTTVELVFKNQSTPENLKSMKQSEGIFNTLNKDKISSGNGLFLIKDLSKMLNGTYEVTVDHDIATVIITLPRGLDDETLDY